MQPFSFRQTRTKNRLAKFLEEKEERLKNKPVPVCAPVPVRRSRPVRRPLPVRPPPVRRSIYDLLLRVPDRPRYTWGRISWPVYPSIPFMKRPLRRHVRRPKRLKRRRVLPKLSEEEFPGAETLEDFPSTSWKRNFSRTDKTFRKRWFQEKKLSLLKMRRKIFKEFGCKGRKAEKKGIAIKRECKLRTLCKRQRRSAKLNDHFRF